MKQTPTLQGVAIRVEQSLGVLAGVALFALMLLTFADVVGRKFLVSIPGTLEISEMLMVVLLFTALPLVAWNAEHVCFEVVNSLYRGRIGQWSANLVEASCAGLFGALAIAVWKLGGRTLSEGEVSSRLHIPIGYFIYLMGGLLACSALMHLVRSCGARPETVPASPEAI